MTSKLPAKTAPGRAQASELHPRRLYGIRDLAAYYSSPGAGVCWPLGSGNNASKPWGHEETARVPRVMRQPLGACIVAPAEPPVVSALLALVVPTSHWAAAPGSSSLPPPLGGRQLQTFTAPVQRASTGRELDRSHMHEARRLGSDLGFVNVIQDSHNCALW